MGRGISLILVGCAFAGCALAQEAAPAPEPSLERRPAVNPPANQTISLTVPKGTALQVVLDKEVRVGKVGQPVHGRVVEPVYAFDKIVIPAESEVTGQVTKIEGPSNGARTAAVLDANFTPDRKLQVEFTELVLPGGKRIPLHTSVTPGSGQTIEFVTAASENQKKSNPTAEKVKEAKQQVKQEWSNAMKRAQEPGKAKRLERFAVGQLPVHPQYVPAGTVYFAELEEPLDFGTEPLTPQLASSIGVMPPDGSVLQARLVTPLGSDTSHQGDAVEAIVSRPILDGERLILPQGSKLEGTVVQAQAAHHPGRNGELRIVFRDLQLPDGVEEKVAASLEGVESAKRDNVRLDSEGGAKAAAPATRFLSTAASVGLGATSFLGDSFGETGPRTAGGAGGFKLIGIGLGLAIHSQPFGMAMGSFGGARSIYSNFIARGHDVVFPKNTAMAISIQQRPPGGATGGAPIPETTEKQ